MPPLDYAMPSNLSFPEKLTLEQLFYFLSLNIACCADQKKEHKRSSHMIRRHLLRIWFPVTQANSITLHCKSCLIRNTF